jgi:Pro-kumamolisin, activation domain
MQGLHKIIGRSLPANSIGGAAPRRRMGGIAVGGIASAWLLLTSGPLFAAGTTVELSPLVYQSALVAPLEDSKQISVLLALPSAHPTDLAAFVKHVSTPGDPLYHQFLTPQQFADRFGGSEADYTSLKNWAAANGLVVSQESVGRINLTLRGNVSRIQKIFQTQLNTYRTSSGETFYSASVKPTVPAEISSKISGLVGLTESKQLTPLVKVAKTLGEDPQVRSDRMRTDSGGTGPGGTYNAKDLRTVYSIPDFGKYKKNSVMAVFEQGYYNPK